jgi:hypothetical protein
MLKENLPPKGIKYIEIPYGDQLIELTHTLIYKAESEYPARFHFRKDLRLYIPDIAIQIMRRTVEENFYRSGYKGPTRSIDFTFQGIRVLEGYEMAIVLAHKDFHYDPTQMVFKVEIK